MITTLVLAILLAFVGSAAGILLGLAVYYRSQLKASDSRYTEILNRALASEADKQKTSDLNEYFRRQTEMILSRAAVVQMSEQQLQWLAQQISFAMPKGDMETIQ